MKKDLDGSIKKRIETEPDFINHSRTENSLKKALETHPEGVSDSRISNMLLIPIEEVEKVYEKIVKKLKRMLHEK